MRAFEEVGGCPMCPLPYDSITGMLDTLTYPTSTSSYRFALKYTTQNGMLKNISNANDSSQVYWALNEAPGGINAFGKITDDMLGGGIVRKRIYDAVTGGLEQLTAGTAGNQASLQNASVEYDQMGNVQQRQSGLAALPNSLIEDFEYGTLNDKLDRLTHVELTEGSTTRTTLDLQYDDFGNILQKTETDGITPVDMTIGWTSYNYPSSISASSLNESASFSYGPDRQRWKMIYQTGSETETTYYLGGLLEKVVTSAGTDFRHYIPGPEEMIGIYSRASSGTNQLRYLLPDYQGSVDAIVDSAGANPVYTSFTPYGVPREAIHWGGAGTTPKFITRQGYTFQTVLGRMGLNHMNGRVQDAISGTFMSPDPFVPDPMNTQAFNRYAYVYNNPMSYTDPSGFSADDSPCQGWCYPPTFNPCMYGFCDRPPPRGPSCWVIDGQSYCPGGPKSPQPPPPPQPNKAIAPVVATRGMSAQPLAAVQLSAEPPAAVLEAAARIGSPLEEPGSLAAWLYDRGVVPDARLYRTEDGTLITQTGETFRLMTGEPPLPGAAKVSSVVRHLHHAWPKYLGGPAKQQLVSLAEKTHLAFHSGLDKILPRQWSTKYYAGLTGAARQQMLKDLASYARQFDAKHGTKLYDAMLRNGFPKNL